MSDPREARVWRVLAASARIADPTDPLGREARALLPAVSGLSPEGVELALAACLERGASRAAMAALLAHASPAARCWIVASANVCTAATRAVALAVATAGEVHLRPSRRDPVVATLLARALGADPAFGDAGGTLTLVDEVRPTAEDEVHAYGSDATMATLAEAFPAGVVLRAHGTGLGVAAVAEGDELLHAADALAFDVVAFDQRGCLSPRVVFVDGGEARAAALASALDRALARWATLVPRGALDRETAAELARWIDTLTAVGTVIRGTAHAVAVASGVASLPLGPPARVVLLVPAGAELPTLVGPIARWITTVGCDEPGAPAARAVLAAAPSARRSALGSMQRPPLDGPVDRRGDLRLRPPPVG